MSVLLRKEIRLASDVVVGAGVLLIASFPLAFLGVAMQGVEPFPWISAVAAGCILNQYTMVLTSALLGAAIFAREREDGNVHFLAMLPLSRKEQILAKVSALLAIWGALWVVNALALTGVVLSTGQGFDTLTPFLLRMFGVVALSFGTLGLASFAGGCVASVTGAAFAGGAALLLIAVIRSFWITVTDTPFFSLYFLTVLALLGVCGLALAAWVFLTDREAAQWKFIRRASATIPARLSKHPRHATRVLLWKDARLMRAPLIAGLLLFALPFIAAGGNAFIAGEAAPGLRNASLLAMALGWIILPMWSASSLASEWSTSTHQFLACLPIAPRRIVAAKLVVAAVPSALVFFVSGLIFLIAQGQIPTEPALGFAMTWDEFNASHFYGGAVAYACALPVTFSVGWYLAARLRRKIVAIILGVVCGPLAMATWAVTSAPEGPVALSVSPMCAIALHGAALAGFSALLVALGAREAMSGMNA